ncbi:Calx-beta domain-containing protein [Sediminicoccus sp. KRV36]|uniref:Calx-beta domain-containing protein n=1 Tax=Sediminicoccus sp. KRV36 TaxID=3133721 RepID=UPI0020102DFC|nr:Calx-beta domain-containing protein [Sediminicoccus rosea]UPY36285.1 cellulase family glycosylhydrolase [Sediminicoccus rosea]
MSDTSAPVTGRIIAVTTAGADITGFNPARDKLDFGDVSVHSFIVVDTAAGVGFMDPWSGATIIIEGVSLGQLTINSFTPIQNDHLRQCLSGALAWEQGITRAANTVYARSHELGQVDRVAFNPATDVVDFRFYGSREQISMTDSAEGVVIANAGTGQALILLGVTKAALKVENFLFYPAEVREDRVHLQLGFATVPDAQVKPQGLPIAGTTAWPTGPGAGAPPAGSEGVTHQIAWLYGVNTTLDFDPAADKLDFGWFKAHEISLSEVNGATVITIEGNRQSYTLAGIGLSELAMSNIVARDPGTRAEWQVALEAAPMLPSVSISDAQATEGDSGITNLAFTVTLSRASASPVSVSYSTLNGSARAGEDFTATIGSVTFAAGEVTKTILIPVLADRVVELSEAFSVQLSAPIGARILDGRATGMIADNDHDPSPATPPSIAIADYTTAEGDAGLTHMRIVLTLSKASTETVTVRYASEDVTAKGGVDYEVLSGTVTFAPGETSQTIHAHLLGDTVVEGNESYRIRLSAPTNATIADGLGIVTVTNDDAAPLPALSIADASIVEGHSGTKMLNVTVTLSKASAAAVTVGYATADDTATAGSDYTAKSGTLTFAAGETSRTIQVAVQGDTAVEGHEAFAIRLSNPTGATIADGAAIATITNDDAAPPASGGNLGYQVSSAWASGFTAAMTVVAGGKPITGWVAEFDAPFTITNIWNAEIVSHVGQHYVIRNLSYNARIAAGGEASFGFQASGGAGNAVTGLLLNAMPANSLPLLSVADASMLEGAGGTANLAFAVTLSAAASAPVTVNYATANGTATAGSDYTAKSGSLTFAAGETSKIVQIAVVGDRLAEASETFNLQISGAKGAAIGDGLAVGTILNDDVAAALSTLSVSNASVLEGGSGTTSLSFTVSLSAAATAPVSVGYATANGTAMAGTDYTARSGTLSFAAGETTKLVTVAVAGDTAIEANETMRLTLANASGATIGTGTGTGTILNDDRPGISIKDASIQEGNPSQGAGWLSTSGNQIVDAAGRSVQIAGVNWFGFEGDNMSPNGLWTRGYKEMMQQMAEEGFNTIRLPFSSDMLHATGEARGIDFSQNADLRGLTPLQVMDRIAAHAEEIGLRIILDHHRSDAGAGTSPNGLWYDATHSEAAWVADWQMLADRYAGNTAIIGADLHNEPHAGAWGGGGARDWAAAAELAGNAIGAVNPNWLIFVEGVGAHQGENYWWGGNLMGVRDRPIELDVTNKVVYSPHDYPNSVYPQPWFQGADFASKLPAKFDQMWGYIFKEGIAPIYLGEFGTKLSDPKDAPWFEAITSYISGDLDNDGTHDLAAGQQGISWTFWSWNPNSGDTGGILKDDWRSVNEEKMAYLRPITFELPSGGGGVAQASFEVSLSAPAVEAVSVAWRTVAGTAGAADFTAAQGSLTFAAGEQTKVIRVAVTGDAVDEANEGFTIQLSNPVGATLTRATAQATILDDDPAAAAGASLTLRGTALDDRLAGGAGADAIFGLGGSDVLTGGGGADRFHFTPREAGRDTITDFNAVNGGAAQGDLLVVDAPALGRFAYLGDAAFTGGGDNSEARVAGNTVLIDVDGDAAADISVMLSGLASARQLTGSDFLFG